MSPEIYPGVLTHSVDEYLARLEGIEKSGAEWAHIDIMDGQFVPNITVMPYEIMGLPTSLKLEAHLMTYRPERYYSDLTVAGVSRVLIHREVYESLEETAAALKQASDYFAEIGLVLNPETAEDGLKDLELDVVQIMGVHPGASGQHILDETCDKIKRVRTLRGDCVVSVDGGVNEENLRNLQKSGASRFVMTSQLGTVSAIPQNFQYFTQLLLSTS